MADDGLSKKLPPWVSQSSWPIAIPEKDRLRLKREAQLSAYQPTSRDRMIGLMADYLHSGGKEGLALAGQSEDSEAREISGEGRRHQPSMFQAPHSILEPPTPFELVNGDTKSGSTARRQIAHALIRRGIMPPTRSTGKFASLARAILDAQAKQKTPTFGGPR